MKVIEADDREDGFVTRVVFDNGLVLESDFEPDCCAWNILDFEQLHTGREFPDMTGEQFLAAISRKPDGFSVTDSFNVPAWVQARSIQNGYYSSGVDLVVYYNGGLVTPPRYPNHWGREHMFEGDVSDE